MMSPLLPPGLLPKLERLSVNSGKRVRGTVQGKRRSGQFGASLEFADYREYTPGDDIRRFDWSVYRRTGRPFVRQYWDEQEMYVSLYLDISASMDFGGRQILDQGGVPGQENKLQYAKMLAAAVGYMALASEDRVQASIFAAKIENRLPNIRGKASASRLFAFLQEAAASGTGDMSQALHTPSSLPSRPGMTWIFSDLWFEGGTEDVKATLSYFLAAGQEVVLVHVVSEDELQPEVSGDLRLVDSELGTGKEIAITGKVLDAYQKELNRYTGDISGYCSERGIRYVQTPTHWQLEKGIFEALRGAGAIAF
ncbi:uncharacterized protein DUF58 [Fontibacillus phaseoli]|uniref:Uncharacterized protein DUF58 n=1 Tax=Fontibacillus phaseoli TaxID=1416533 RepID=A0A369BFU9_9BACL|nr:DUF58 domain-containing protein [Fontibacillus phaseoli]RCX20412.1 uncharacterized protein DUF58 [Fontibacillus phaseoli]